MTRKNAKIARVLGIGILLIGAVVPLRAEKILYLGDSLSMGAFGRTMDEQMRAAGHEVYTYVTGGATPYYWLSIYDVQRTTIGHWEKTPTSDTRRKAAEVPKIEALLKKHRPEIVVVQTGVNLYAQLRSRQRTKKENVREVTMLVRNMGETIKAAGAVCFWVSPPDSHPSRYPEALQDEMFQIMKRTASRYGTVFDSRSVTDFTDPFPKTDGIHYGPKEAKAWGNLVFEEINAWAIERTGRRAERPLMAAFRAKEAGGQTLASMSSAIPRPDATPVAAKIPGGGAVPDAETIARNKRTSKALEEARAIAVAARQRQEEKMAAEKRAAEKRAAEVALAKARVQELAEKKARALAAVEKNVEPAPEPGLAAEPVPGGAPDVFMVKRARPGDSPSDEVSVDIKLVGVTACPAPTNVDYGKALAVYEWEVTRVRSGTYPAKTIRVAHTIYWNGKKTGAANWKIGRTWSLDLAVLSRYPRVEQWQTFDDLELNTDLPVYLPKM